MSVAVEPEIANGRRAFGMAQFLFLGSPFGAAQRLSVGWHDSSVDPETGAFAVVAQGAGLDDLVGEIVQVSLTNRAVFVYVLRAADVPVQVSLTRRAFGAIGRLSIENASGLVVVTR